MRTRLAFVAAVAVALVAPAPAAAAAPATVTRSYPASTAVIANPGRGFFTYTETSLTDFQPLDDDGLIQARRTEARSVVYRNFYLTGRQDADLAPADLAKIEADFTTARAAGVKLVLRFAYSADSDADAPEVRVLGHIAQLGPILTANADIITAIQAGFIGRWGEWYYTQNFADWTARGHVLAALLAATSPTTPIQVRTPEIKRRLAPTATRVGVHDDCFLAGTDDYGTFQAADDRAWLATQSRTAIVGGETCAPSERSGWADAATELATYHWTYLNPAFNSDVLTSWGTAGLAEASRRLGYRLRLTMMRLRPGGTVTLTFVNDGYAAPTENRPLRVTALTGSIHRTVTIPTDLRTWQPARPVTVTARLPLPRGTTRLYLSLPDPSPRLAATPAYAIQLANPAVWDAARGWNTLGTVRV